MQTPKTIEDQLVNLLVTLEEAKTDPKKYEILTLETNVLKRANEIIQNQLIADALILRFPGYTGPKRLAGAEVKHQPDTKAATAKESLEKVRALSAGNGKR